MSQEIVKESYITTTDNPFNPFTNSMEWFCWDRDKGYNTNQLIDRESISIFDKSSNELDEDELIIVLKRIIALLPNFYKLITNETLIEQIPINVDDSEIE